MIDAVAFESQFVDHLAPVWRALPDRGEFYVDPALVDHAKRRGIDAVAQPRPDHVITQPPPQWGDRPALVASYGDIKEARRLGYGPFAFLEHGAGQAYPDSRMSGSYAGGVDREDNELILVPNEYAASRWRAAYPSARVEIVGCPKLDGLPRREYTESDFIGLQSWAWSVFDAAIRQRPTTFGLTDQMGTVCVAHAIADASRTAPDDGNSLATQRKPSTTASDTYDVDLTLPLDQPALVARLMEAVRSGTSTCTSSCIGHSHANATSAELRPEGLRSHSVGIRLRKTGSSTNDSGTLSVEIRTTTFGSVSFAMPTTTVRAAMPAPEGPRAVVACSFHWPAPLAASGYAGTAVGDFLVQFPALAKAFPGIIGHAHPKGDWPQRMARLYERVGIPFVGDFEDICRRADVYICDNSSTLFEFAATGKPVVVLNSREWARARGWDPNPPGLRFWDAAQVGINVDAGQDLVAAVREALVDDPARQAAREDALRFVYGVRTGAAELAAAAITEWVVSRQLVAA